MNAFLRTGDIACELAGWGVARLPWDQIASYRKDPGGAGALNPAPPLKTADEHTVIGWAALCNACERAGWCPSAFTDWGILAAPTYIGRTRLAPSFRRFPKMGPRGVSPLIIPTMSNHSVAGTICLILGSHGPNFGIAGSTPLVEELLLNALLLCDGERCPGIWAIMTAFDPEPIPDDAGKPIAPTVGIGVALALKPGTASSCVKLSGSQTNSHGTVFELADFLEQARGNMCWTCPIVGGGQFDLRATHCIPLRKAG